MFISAIYSTSSRITHTTCTSHRINDFKAKLRTERTQKEPSDPGKHWSFIRILRINTRWFLAWRLGERKKGGKKKKKTKRKRCAHRGTEDEIIS